MSVSRPALGDTASETGASSRLVDAAIWRRLLSAPDQKAFSNAWLELLCAQIDLGVGPLVDAKPVVRQAMVALATPGSRKFARVAWLGAEHDVSLLLAKAGERAIQVRHGVVQVDENQGGVCQIAHPILIGENVFGVVALELPLQAKAHLDIAMRFAQWGVSWFSHLFQAKPGSGAPADDDKTLRLDTIETILSAGRSQPATEAFATLLADRLGCDKVAVGRYRHGRSALIALSHGGFAKVKNAYISALTAAMDEAVDHDAPIRYPLPADDLAAPHASHAALARSHGADWIQSVVVDLDPQGEERLVLIAEGRGSAAADVDRELEVIADDAARILWLRFKAEQDPLQRTVAVVRDAVHAHPRWVYGAWVGAALVFIGALFIPLPFRIGTDATVETLERRVMAAPFDGYLADASARPGDAVKAGTVLARFDDRDLKNQRMDVSQRLLETTRELNEAIGMLDRAKANVLSARKAQIEADLALVEEQLRRVELRAPFDAIVVAGDKTQSIGSPVRRGEPLYEISPQGSFRVALDVSQSDFADIQAGQEGELVLSALPFESRDVRISRLTPIAMARDGKTVLRAEADLVGPVGLLRPGMQGVAHIRVGTAPAGWLYTHRIVNWLKFKFWTWMP